MSDYHFTVAVRDDGSAYVVGECARCGATSIYEADAIDPAVSLPCPCGHSVEVTPWLYERMRKKVREEHQRVIARSAH